jgi:hypothetical protein
MTFEPENQKTPAWGPWSAGCRGHLERVAQLRTLRAIAHLQLGPDHPLVGELRASEVDPMAFTRSQEMVERLPALKLRHLLAAFSAITWPAYDAERERVADGGPTWTPGASPSRDYAEPGKGQEPQAGVKP